jgi:hypothetical protein
MAGVGVKPPTHTLPSPPISPGCRGESIGSPCRSGAFQCVHRRFVGAPISRVSEGCRCDCLHRRRTAGTAFWRRRCSAPPGACRVEGQPLGRAGSADRGMRRFTALYLLSHLNWVGRRGLEPLTPCASCKCATNCANGPWRETLPPASPTAVSIGTAQTGAAGTPGAGVARSTAGQPDRSRRRSCSARCPPRSPKSRLANRR